MIDGLKATVVTVALSADSDAISERRGLFRADWHSRLPQNSSP
ncbi:Hypothetical protein RAK1035_2943 [Roseovarius sp. AK1035]|nr:Hypothetical protein RAK1035_2943 [Roseovarius sp. AK1035]